ncbi:DNA polymerase III subunit delta [Sphingomonas sp. GCM10030256]|uniref:DNA polymerase III subunit delta n=1 Tax=Sphingomonas sp. GCM10030256 TaxID=3273427 RepID=UPI0036190EF8
MKSNRGTIAAAIERPDPNCRFYLFHGADESGSRALAARLLSSLAAEKVPFTGAALKGDPAALADEAGAISMFGGRRLLWIEPAGDDSVAAVEALLAAPAVESAAVAIAGTLRKTSGLLKLAEAHRAALAHASYIPEGRDADRMIQEIGRSEGLIIGPALASRIATATANDQAIARQELAKFALYLGANPASPRELDEDAVDLLGADDSDTDAGRPGDLALAGDVQALSDELERLQSCGIDPFPVIRALQRRLLSVAPLLAKVAAGQRIDAVMASVWKRDQVPVGRILRKWTPERLARVTTRVSELEREVLLSAVDDRAALGEELLQIARAAR